MNLIEIKPNNNEEKWLIDNLLNDTEIQDKIAACGDENLTPMWDFIKENARKQAKNGVAMIEDNQVLSWARDYFIEWTPKPKTEPKPKPIPKPEPKPQEPIKKVKKFDLFDLLDEN